MEHGLRAVDLLPQQDLFQLHGLAAAGRVVAELLHAEDAMIEDILLCLGEADALDPRQLDAE